jgi:predicted nucleic acid-binding protein
MYLIGAAHPHKVHAQRLLQKCVADRRRLVTDAEVLQEILHRYVAIDRREAIPPAFEVLKSLVDEVFPIDGATVDRAKGIILETRRLSARDAIHVAVMQRHRIARIFSFDTGFDGIAGIERLTA